MDVEKPLFGKFFCAASEKTKGYVQDKNRYCQDSYGQVLILLVKK